MCTDSHGHGLVLKAISGNRVWRWQRMEANDWRLQRTELCHGEQPQPNSHVEAATTYRYIHVRNYRSYNNMVGIHDLAVLGHLAEMGCFGQNRLGEGKGVSLNKMLMNKFIAFKEPTIAIQNKLDFEVHCWDSAVESVLLLVASPTNSEQTSLLWKTAAFQIWGHRILFRDADRGGWGQREILQLSSIPSEENLFLGGGGTLGFSIACNRNSILTVSALLGTPSSSCPCFFFCIPGLCWVSQWAFVF